MSNQKGSRENGSLVTGVTLSLKRLP